MKSPERSTFLLFYKSLSIEHIHKGTAWRRHLLFAVFCPCVFAAFDSLGTGLGPFCFRDVAQADPAQASESGSSAAC